MGTDLVRVLYLRTMGEVEAATWEMSTGSTELVEAGNTGDIRVPWLGKGGLAR